MKHTLYIIITAALLCACSDIAPEERLIPVPFLPEDLIQRNVLIEDFTGQNCPNCPTAAEVIEGLEEGYGEHLIGVSIHSGGLSLKGKSGLWTEFGETRFAKLGTNLPQPTVRVDRTSAIFTGGAEVQNGLHSAVRTQLQKGTPITIGNYTSQVVDESTNTLDYSVSVGSTQDIEVQVQVWIMEDGIVARQSMPDGSHNKEYVHKGVLRVSMTTPDGETLKLEAGQTKELNLSYMLPLSNWEYPNCHAVVIVSLPNDGEVLQVAKFSLLGE